MTDQLWSYIVLGGGPAGLQLGYYLEQAGCDHLILERGPSAGTFFQQFPRHRTLISSNKVHTGYTEPELQMRFDWNSLLTDDFSHLFRDYSRRYFANAADLRRYLQDFAQKYTPQIRTGVDVRKISRANDEFLLTDAAGQCYRTRRLIVATGVSRPYFPEIAGLELAESYVDCAVDPDSFMNQRVLVIGKGNSGFETANNLVETAAVIHIASPHSLKFAWATHYPGHLRAVNNNFLDTYQLKTQNAVLDATIDRIAREPDGRLRVYLRYAHASGETESIVYDRVLACTGFAFDASIFDSSCTPALTINDRFPAQTSAWESVNVEGLYFAGTITQPRDFKKTNSGFIHGFRYNARALFRILQQRYEDRPWPAQAIPATVDGLVDAVLGRVNISSGLWQQFGFLADVIVLDGQDTRLLAEVPVDFVHDSTLGREQNCVVITLEFGAHQPDPFAVVRNPDPECADESFFLHPVIRHYRRGTKLRELHLLEDLFGEWKSEANHRAPLRAFFEQQLPTASTATPLAWLDFNETVQG